MKSARQLQAQASASLKMRGGEEDKILLGTWNAGTLNGIFNQTLDENQHLDILCVQESRHDEQTMHSMRQVAKIAGWESFFGQVMKSTLGCAVGGIAVFSKWPTEQVDSGEIQHEDALQRVVILKVYQPKEPPIILYVVYLHSSDAAAAVNLGEAIFRHAAGRREQKIIIGDWNRLPTQQPAGRAVAAGDWKIGEPDDSQVDQSVPTRRDGRHIDYMISSPSVNIAARRQMQANSDHDKVEYDIKIGQLPKRYLRQKTVELRKDGYEVSLQQWEEKFSMVALDFYQALEDKDTNTAWKLLSATAEEVLRDPKSTKKGRKRHMPAKPVVQACMRKCTKDLEGITVQRITRLTRRLQEFHRNDDIKEHNLLNNILKDIHLLGARFGEIKTLDYDNPECIVRMQSFLDTVRSEEKERRIAKWNARLQDEHKMQKWVTAAPVQQPQRSEDGGGRLDPQQEVEREAKKWQELWNPTTVPKYQDLNGYDDWIHHEAKPMHTPTLNHEELKKIVLANSAKAAGPDDWTPAAWCLLPAAFFQGLAAIWNLVLRGACIPEAWLDVRVCLLPKEDEEETGKQLPKPAGDRPLSIASLAWRIGLAAVLKRGDWREWIKAWLVEEVAGGVPGCSCAEIHDMLQEGIANAAELGEDFCGGKVDLRKCFDKCSAEIGITLLEGLGLPKTMGDMIRQFYDKHRKWFEKDGAIASFAVQVTNSILQGCPFSMLLLAAQTCLWVREVKKAVPGAIIGTYVDDRGLLTVGSSCVEDLLEAHAIGDKVDAALGWTKHPEKLKSFSSSNKIAKKLADHSGTVGPCVNKFKLLGIQYTVRKKRLCQNSAAKAAKVARRLGRIKVVGGNFWRRRRLVRSTVLPIITYTGAWTVPTKAQTSKWESHIERTILGKNLAGRSRLLVWAAALGAEANPGHMLDVEALRHECWRLRRRNMARIHGEVDPTRNRSGRWQTVAASWSWKQMGEDGVYQTPEGQVDLGAIGKPALVVLTGKAFERIKWLEDKRCKEPQQPAIALHTEVDLATHKKWIRDAISNSNWNRLRAATGAAFDHKAIAGMRKRNGMDDIQLLCQCGQVNPDREHWAWSCASLQPLRDTCRIRSLATRKLCVPRKKKQASFSCENLAHPDIDTIVRGLRVQKSKGLVPTLGTDGGATDGRAAWALSAGSGYTIGAEISGADSSPYIGELAGAYFAAQAVARAGFFTRIAIDNSAVQRASARFAKEMNHQKCRLPKYFSSWFRRIADLKADYSTHWIPSHGKYENFCSGFGEDETQRWRDLNEQADLVASEKAKTAAERTSATKWKSEEFIVQRALERILKGSEEFTNRYLRLHLV
jgi:hypothetical protein